ncbi:hypothetical protein Cch01nite_35330 [Cellulomonas chitinilytica]|uniref:Uncharacterized protein n=1 Tax=Cellulomonas chitinilytica TaxID=398759 RepID=A0A919U459_9CELL|nr:hypothetical protein [Cellulomonas chitinilytica]GIG22809.1 hypothetical protein Cch01nite_35330 [Cellulomonas chitinilytica]
MHPDAAPDNIEPVKDLLDAHVPLTLLVDLLTDAAPPSAEILESEGLPDTPWWEQDTPGTGTSGEPPA